MPELIYLLCAATSLFGSGLCFSVLAINNMILVLDKLVFPDANFSLWRLSSALVALLLLFGLIWQDD